MLKMIRQANNQRESRQKNISHNAHALNLITHLQHFVVVLVDGHLKVQARELAQVSVSEVGGEGGREGEREGE